MSSAFGGAFTTLCEMLIDVVAVTVCAACAFGGTELAMRMGNIHSMLGIDVGDVMVVFGLGLDVLPAPLPVLLFFEAGSP